MAKDKTQTAVLDPAPPVTTESLLDDFMDSLTPGHHRAAAVPYAAMEVNRKDLRMAARNLMRAAQGLPPIEEAVPLTLVPPVVDPTLPSPYTGALDPFTPSGVLSGYATNGDLPEALVGLRLLVDDADVALLIANQARPEPGVGAHGFSYQFHAPFAPDVPHTIRLFFPDGTEMPGSPIEVVAVVPVPDGTSGPVLTSVSPRMVAAGQQGGVDLTLEGAGFVTTSVGCVDGSPRPTVVSGPTRLVVSVPYIDIRGPGQLAVTVQTPGMPETAALAVTVISPRRPA